MRKKYPWKRLPTFKVVYSDILKTFKNVILLKNLSKFACRPILQVNEGHQSEIKHFIWVQTNKMFIWIQNIVFISTRELKKINSYFYSFYCNIIFQFYCSLFFIFSIKTLMIFPLVKCRAVDFFIRGHPLIKMVTSMIGCNQYS